MMNPNREFPMIPARFLCVMGAGVPMTNFIAQKAAIVRSNLRGCELPWDMGAIFLGGLQSHPPPWW
jgi:hypothetical protein